MYDIVHRWVGKVRGLTPWNVHKDPLHSKNVPGGSYSVSGDLHRPRSSAVKTELKEFSQYLKAFPIKIKAQPIDVFSTDLSVKTNV
jgi:hypothetical protein